MCARDGLWCMGCTPDGTNCYDCIFYPGDTPPSQCVTTTGCLATEDVGCVPFLGHS